ncbi:unnamed protein product [Protopolystoma xenopodis]|uniref:Uncharacterized protein n=1 Tax=Protopolystoma xenopodis TaxID=117903 RepID=A0A448XF94_9PLAT|nr:unnamed protein product [Protopolystoma xenopodis]
MLNNTIQVLTSMSLLGGKKPPDSRSRRVAALSASPNSLAADPDNQLCIGSIGSDGRHVSHSSMHISGGGSGNIAVGSGSVSGSGSELSHATSGNGTGGRRSGRKQRS